MKNIAKLLTIVILLIMSSVAVSAATFDGTAFGFPSVTSNTGNTYKFTNNGKTGFDARNYAIDNQQAYFDGNTILRDFIQNYESQQNSMSNTLGGDYNNNQNQGTVGYRKDFTESYGTCEPGEQTWNQNIRAVRKNFPLQSTNRYQKRSVQVFMVRASGCDGYRKNVAETSYGNNNFNNQQTNANTYQTQDNSNVRNQMANSMSQQQTNFAAGKTVEIANGDFYAPVVGSRLQFNRYY
ncbi:MAG: hypothetical protein Q7R96_03565 [Nanoarchaeota archaeon]|nr:hypothetical protein [Nanoarchaeota archaeon]